MAKKNTGSPTTPRPRRVAKTTAPAPGNGSAAPGNGGVTNHTPTADEIAQAAYQRYLSRGGQHGSDFDDWIEAERELANKHTR
jgi:hypothetical protein